MTYRLELTSTHPSCLNRNPAGQKTNVFLRMACASTSYSNHPSSSLAGCGCFGFLFLFILFGVLLMQVSLQPLRQGACRATLAAVCVFCLSGFALAQVSASLKPLPPDPAAERFIADLIGKMTLEEKVAQMSQVPLNQPSAVPPEEACPQRSRVLPLHHRRKTYRSASAYCGRAEPPAHSSPLWL